DRLLADLSLLFIAAVWGATFFMVKDATAQFPVLYFLALRFGLASLALIPLALLLKRRPTGAELRWGILGGVLFCCGYIFQTFALGQIDSGRVGFITGLYVILVPIQALIFLRHRLKLRAIIGASLAVIGLALLSNAPGGNLAGDGLAFLCALSFAAQIIVVERFPRDADWRMMSLIQAACVGGISGGIAIFAEPLPASIPISVLGVAAFTGLLATALGLAIQVWAQRRLPPSDAAIMFAMESPFSALFGFLFLGERLTLGGLLGCGLILVGMLTTALTGEDPSEFH
ncbi:MAG TPA: DMT family transporter, partial [Aggregatilineales bacterium]|nr:DMT family transporter [Aggregatilineales bacterium]